MVGNRLQDAVYFLLGVAAHETPILHQWPDLGRADWMPNGGLRAVHRAANTSSPAYFVVAFYRLATRDGR